MTKEQGLTIKQIQYVLGMSYPTALAFATEHGDMVDGRWLVPESVVQGVVDSEILKAHKTQARLTSLSVSGG